MASRERQTRYMKLMKTIGSAMIAEWGDIHAVLSALKQEKDPGSMSWDHFREEVTGGIAFITFDYGIDGVSIEIAKYASALEGLLGPEGASRLHFIGGDFYTQAEAVLKPTWKRFRINGMNGWSKWNDGTWFSGLFYEEMPAGSSVSGYLAEQIYLQAVKIARTLGLYVLENDIRLLIPVNIHSNPGNIALALATAFVTEGMGLYVINSNHDFYWEGGKPASERIPGEAAGVRDHFFFNMSNAPFFELLQQLYPWKGQRWIQVNINHPQSRALIEKRHFDAGEVFELSTSISNTFLESYSSEDVRSTRLRMAHILSNGSALLHPAPVAEHLAGLGTWMHHQEPCILGARSGLCLDPVSPALIYLLQPTRVIARKRIEKDIELLRALLKHKPFREAFDSNPDHKILLQVTGPTPIEHQADLEAVLQAFLSMIDSLPNAISDRLFLAFSVGNEHHPCFQKLGFERLRIEDIYRMATAVVFPSETEGRGLPIIEASASRIPLICSRYQPEEVFAGVVGEELREELQIRYTLFPEGDFTPAFLDEVTQLLLHPDQIQAQMDHNQQAVRERYSAAVMKTSFENLLHRLYEKVYGKDS
ncbi:MAG: glycosyltransferase family 4 protein [Anaerolineales bacterium]|nr:glycosyltransferase family 4 protein [Anaerolineales bacterium]